MAHFLKKQTENVIKAFKKYLFFLFSAFCKKFSISNRAENQHLIIRNPKKSFKPKKVFLSVAYFAFEADSFFPVYQFWKSEIKQSCTRNIFLRLR